MKKLRLLLPLMLLLLTSGCLGVEPDSLAYVTAIGFDKAQGGNLEVTVQYAKPASISGGGEEGGGGGGEDIVENVSVEAPNLYSGINIANHVVSKRFSLSHIKLLVFSGDVALDGMQDILITVAMSEEIRPNVYMAVTAGSAKQYLDSVKPTMEINPTKYYQMVFEDNSEGGIPKNTAQNFFFYRRTNERDGVLPLAGVIDENEDATSEAAPVNKEGFEYHVKNYMAGQVSEREGNKSEIIGMAVFKNDKLIGKMGSIECELYNILTGDFKDGYLTFYLEKTPDLPITVKMFKNKKPKTEVDLKNREIKITVYMESDLYSLPDRSYILSNMDYLQEQLRKDLEYAANRFINKIQKEYGADILGLGSQVKKKFLTYTDFEEYNWKEQYADFKISVDVDLAVRRTGLIWNSEK